MNKRFEHPATCCDEKHHTLYCPHCGKRLQVPCDTCGELEPYDSTVCFTETTRVCDRAMAYAEQEVARRSSKLETLSIRATEGLFRSGRRAVTALAIGWGGYMLLLLGLFLFFVPLGDGILEAFEVYVIGGTAILFALLYTSPLWIALSYMTRREYRARTLREEYLHKHSGDAARLRLHVTNGST